MNEIKETIEGLKRIKDNCFKNSRVTGVSIESRQVDFPKALFYAIQILEAHDQAGEELGGKKISFPYKGEKCERELKHEWERIFGYNKMHTIATAVVAKKNGRIAELEKSEYQIRANYGDLLSDFRQSEKEFQSLKSSIIEKLKKAKYPVFTIKTSEQLNKKIDIIIKELKGTNERTN